MLNLYLNWLICAHQFCFLSPNNYFKPIIQMTFRWENYNYASCCIWVWNMAFTNWRTNRGWKYSGMG